MVSLEILQQGLCVMNLLQGCFSNARDTIFFSFKEIQRRGAKLIEENIFSSEEKKKKNLKMMGGIVIFPR